MLPQVKTIRLPMPFRLGHVNCYLVEGDQGHLLIDTGPASSRALLERELMGAGCRPGVLQLIVLTHGDFDHTGNAAYLRAGFGAPIAMHAGDLGMAQRGDMFSNRSKGSVLLRTMAPLLFRFGKSQRFEPDLTLQDGDSLSEYGLDAQVLSIPGHSSGSIGLLTAGGDLFCGDLFENISKPGLNSIMDDLVTANASFDRLSKLDIVTVYPGHGEPFQLDLLLAERPEGEDAHDSQAP
jgi:hydroxyacylglutathione hydrolase